MKSLLIDIETISSAPLPECGVYKYSESPDFRILLFGYSIDGGKAETIDFTAGETLPDEVLKALTDPEVTKWAFNAQFERICLSVFLGIKYLDPAQWRCVMMLPSRIISQTSAIC